MALNLQPSSMGVPGLQGPYASAQRRPGPNWGSIGTAGKQLAGQFLAPFLGGRAEAGGNLEKAVRAYKVAAHYEGTDAYAEEKAGQLATFKDQPQVIQSMIENDAKLKTHGRTYLKALLGLMPSVRPETLSPAARQQTYGQERAYLESQLPGMRGKLAPGQAQAWAGAMQPGFGQMGFPKQAAPPGGEEFQRLTKELFGAAPVGRGEAARRAVAGEEVPEVAERYKRYMTKVEPQDLGKTERPLAAFLTEGGKSFMSFPGDTQLNLEMTYPALMQEPLKTFLGMEDLETFNPGASIKKQPLLGRLAAFISLVNNLQMDEKVAIYVFQDWFNDWFGEEVASPAWMDLGFPQEFTEK